MFCLFVCSFHKYTYKVAGKLTRHGPCSWLWVCILLKKVWLGFECYVGERRDLLAVRLLSCQRFSVSESSLLALHCICFSVSLFLSYKWILLYTVCVVIYCMCSVFSSFFSVITVKSYVLLLILWCPEVLYFVIFLYENKLLSF